MLGVRAAARRAVMRAVRAAGHREVQVPKAELLEAAVNKAVARTLQ
jgi:hypothetical protein